MLNNKAIPEYMAFHLQELLLDPSRVMVQCVKSVDMCTTIVKKKHYFDA